MKSTIPDIINDKDFPKLSYSIANNDNSDNTIASIRASSQRKSSTRKTTKLPDDGINNEIPCSSNLNTDIQNNYTKPNIESTLDGLLLIFLFKYYLLTCRIF